LVDWSVGYPCEKVVRIKYPPTFQSNISRIEDIDETLVEEHLPLISKIDPHILFGDSPLADDAFILGGSVDKADPEVDDDVLYAEYCHSVGEDQSGFQHCPLPLVQLNVVVQGYLF